MFSVTRRYYRLSIGVILIGWQMAIASCGEYYGENPELEAWSGTGEMEQAFSNHFPTNKPPFIPLFNVAYQKPAIQSSTYSSATAARAVDGDTDGHYFHHSVSHTKNEKHPSLEIDFLGFYRIKQIDLYNRTDCCSDRLRDVRVWLYNDGDFDHLLRLKRGSLGSVTSFDFEGHVGNRVKIELEGTDYLQLAEVVVWSEVQPVSPQEVGAKYGAVLCSEDDLQGHCLHTEKRVGNLKELTWDNFHLDNRTNSLKIEKGRFVWACAGYNYTGKCAQFGSFKNDVYVDLNTLQQHGLAQKISSLLMLYEWEVFFDNGRIFKHDANLAAWEFRGFIDTDPTLADYQHEIVDIAANEAIDGYCENEARKRYDASGKFCSEFVRWVYLEAGVENCPGVGFHRGCFSWVNTTSYLASIFKKSDLYIDYDDLTVESARPGYYLSMNSADGEKKTHSAIIVGRLWDGSKIWVVDATTRDGSQCVRLRQLNYLTSSGFNARINGIGKVTSKLF